MLMKIRQARQWPLPLPAGYDWDDISYVVGGYKWKARYLNDEGYFITSAPPGAPGNNQYNVMTGRWVAYEAGKVKPYDCGRCHTTGYSPEGHQDNKPGIVGSWVLEGIQCEACHGPGSRHADSQSAADIQVDVSAAACGKCHVRGDPTKIPAKDGFIQHHEQYNEFLASPHVGASCVDCHEPHQKSDFSIHTACQDCHEEAAAEFEGSRHERRGLECESCHMPMATKSAEQLGFYKGDVKTHLFRINTDPTAPMFTSDGKFAYPYVTLGFACLQCHQDKDLEWAGDYAPGVHTLGK